MVISRSQFYFKKVLRQIFTLRKEHTQSLESSYWQNLFEQQLTMQVVIDSDSKLIVDVNQAVCNYYGGTKEELVGKPFKQINLVFGLELPQKFDLSNQDWISVFYAPNLVKDGEIKIFDVHAHVIKDGHRTLIHAILFDSASFEAYRDSLVWEKEFLQNTLFSIDSGVITTDKKGVITSLNNVVIKMMGGTREEALGKSCNEYLVFVNEVTGVQVKNPVEKVMESWQREELKNHTLMLCQEGTRIPIAASAAPIYSNAKHNIENQDQIEGIVVILRDISIEKNHIREMEYISYHDSLTGLYNRRYFDEKIMRLEKNEIPQMMVIVADVNGLKITNDVFGLQAGDELLKKTADVLRRYCRQQDIIVRMGGDEFVVLMPRSSLQEAEWFITEIQQTELINEKSKLPLSISFGCALLTTQGISKALQQADKSMYQQKLLVSNAYRNSLVSSFLEMLYENSDETKDHSERIAYYCNLVGKKLELGSQELDEIRLLSLLHDIGKVGIDSNILNKPEALSVEESLEIKRHCEIGFRIAFETPALLRVAELILYHHERWDGKGYPQGLKNTEIPLACRILSVVDAFDAMIHDSTYRKGISVFDAIIEIDKNAGTQFDPKIVKLMIEILNEKFSENMRITYQTS